jgi:hypothetical protein
VRKFAPLLLAHFEFHTAPAADELLQALDLLRDFNASGKRTLPEHVPTGFVKPRWRPHVYASGGVDRHFYELCALAELRDRLRAGDIWVTGSRQYRDFETYLIPAATLARRNRSATGDASQGLNFPAGTWPAETQALNEAATCSW